MGHILFNVVHTYSCLMLAFTLSTIFGAKTFICTLSKHDLLTIGSKYRTKCIELLRLKYRYQEKYRGLRQDHKLSNRKVNHPTLSFGNNLFTYFANVSIVR